MACFSIQLPVIYYPGMDRLDEYVKLTEALSDPRPALPQIALLAWYRQYSPEHFALLWQQVHPASNVHQPIPEMIPASCSFLHKVLQLSRADFRIYLSDIERLHWIVRLSFAGQAPVGWGGNVVYGLLRRKYPDEFRWMLRESC